MLTKDLLFRNNSRIKWYLLFLKLCRHIRRKPSPVQVLSGISISLEIIYKLNCISGKILRISYIANDIATVDPH